MSDIKTMFAKLNSKGGGGDVGLDVDVTEVPVADKPVAASKKKPTIEKTYQKKTQLEHILLRPDTYIGSVEKASEMMWIYDAESKKMVQKQIEYVPGLYKIFDEILVNAADNKQRDPKMDCIKVEINASSNTISVYNNGKGIPVVIHKGENMFVPTMIFGHLLTSSNYNDEEEKVTGGRNGYGAKLCNIFSTKFTVETASKEYKKQFKQTWGSNMTKASEAKIREFQGEEFTKISFCPDLEKFKLTELDEGFIGLLSRRAFDVAASTRGVKVFLNGQRLPVKNFKEYMDLYIRDKEDDQGNPLKIIHETASERWEVGLTKSDRGFQQVSFVNSIATSKGGRHVDYVVEMIVKQLIEVLKKRNKGGINIKPFQVKNHIWIFINCLIVNPTFDSQTKENMTLQMKSFGSKCTLTEKFINQVTKCGIVESILSWAKYKAQNELAKKTSGKKMSKLKGIPKLEDANEAGTKKALKCTLILTEGDSAKSLAVSGLGVIGRDYYGVFPLRGKLLNVREATHKQILENQEINNLIKIVGLQYKKKYSSEEDMRTLRYGKIMIMTDQDQDGSHIKGLLINFIHCNWPELLHQNFLEEFITPIVKATKKGQELSFYSLPEFEEWKTNTENAHTFHIKYYKGLGTSTSKEAKEYFTNMARHRIKFRYQGQQDDDHIVLAFSRKHIEHRKEWLTNFMVESRRRKEIGLPEKYLYAKDTKFVSFTDFVNLELVLFSNADNVRSIPCLVDGFKPGQRKIIFTCFKRSDKREVKVAQLTGSVAEQSAYHHGEVSLSMTIVNLAQNFVGSNNINLLEPRGQFGTRLTGGKDSASPRYIFTKLSPLTRMIFHPHDDPILKHEYDDNVKIEPVWYIPIIPMLLVNGADGIGTGWMTKIPNFNPRDIVKNLRALLDEEDTIAMTPWYKNFKGTIEHYEDSRYVCNGELSIVGDSKIEITELPVGTWTQNYKENVLEVLLHGSEKVKSVISDYKEYNTDTTVKFVITVTPEQFVQLEKEGLYKVFKLQTMMTLSSMCAFDELGCLRRFDSVMDILSEYFVIRVKMYQKRKDHMEGMLEAEALKLSNQARFILEKCSGDLTVENKKRKIIVDELIRKGYDADPVMEWKLRHLAEETEEPADEDQDENEESREEQEPSKKKTNAKAEASDAKKYDYLLGMSMWMLTDERKNELLKQRDNKLTELNILRKKTKHDLWREDLDAFIAKLDEVENKERAEEAGVQSKDAKKVVGKKKQLLQETMPSPAAKRVAPTISDEIKKKIQMAIKAKDQRGKKGTKKESITEEEVDEFDIMVKSKKTLKDKLGTPEEAESKAKNKGKDGLKQTKLNFKKEPRKGDGSPKKRRKQFSDDSDSKSTPSGSDVEFVQSSPAPVRKERFLSRRTATKAVSYGSSDDSDKEEEVLFENDALNDDKPVQEMVMDVSSGSENESPPAKHETSEDMFDSWIGKKKVESSKETQPMKKRKKALSLSESEKSWKSSDDDSEPIKPRAKPRGKANTKVSNKDGDSKSIKPPAKPRGKKETKDPKTANIDSDSEQLAKPKEIEKKETVAICSDSDSEPIKPMPKKRKADLGDKKTKPKKTKNAKKIDEDEDFENDFQNNGDKHSESDDEPPSRKTGRAGRETVKTVKYVFSDSD